MVRIATSLNGSTTKICDVPLDVTPYLYGRAAFEQEFIALSERFTSCPVEPVALKGNACASVVYGGDDSASFEIDANANAGFEIVDLDEPEPTGIPAQLGESQKGVENATFNAVERSESSESSQKTSKNASNLQENASETPDSTQKTQENAPEPQKDAALEEKTDGTEDDDG